MLKHCSHWQKEKQTSHHIWSLSCTYIDNKNANYLHHYHRILAIIASYKTGNALFNLLFAINVNFSYVHTFALKYLLIVELWTRLNSLAWSLSPVRSSIVNSSVAIMCLYCRYLHCRELHQHRCQLHRRYTCTEAVFVKQANRQRSGAHWRF